MLLKQDAVTQITDEAFIQEEIRRFKFSKRRLTMMEGDRYYRGHHDILMRQRTAIGRDGKLEVIRNVPNHRIVDNQYKKMVDQKANYLLGQPVSAQTDNPAYSRLLKQFFNKHFLRTLKAVGEDALNGGIGWLHLCYDPQGELVCKRFHPSEVIAGWADSDHTRLDYAIRVYEVISYQDSTEQVVEKVEVYEDTGVSFFELENGVLTPVPPFHQDYITLGEGETAMGYNWSRIPLIHFKYNSKEIPLIQMVKPLQDGLNLVESNFMNEMSENTHNTIIVLVNYDGENLGEFRQNLATYNAIKLSTVDGVAGDVKTLQIEVNSTNYQVILELFKKAIIENAMGYDAKDDRLSGTPNQMNIQSMYSDIDLDANGMETEFQASFEQLLWFLNAHLFNTGLGDFEGEEVAIIFNRDMLLNETEVIDNCTKSVGLLSDETVISNHPWVDDTQAELDRLSAQQTSQAEQYGNAFPTKNLEQATEGVTEGTADEQ